MTYSYIINLLRSGAAEAVAVGEDHAEDDDNGDGAPNVSDNFLRSFVKNEAHM